MGWPLARGTAPRPRPGSGREGASMRHPLPTQVLSQTRASIPGEAEPRAQLQGKRWGEEMPGSLCQPPRLPEPFKSPTFNSFHQVVLCCLQKTGICSKSCVPDAKTSGSRVPCTGLKLPLPAVRARERALQNSFQVPGHRQLLTTKRKGRKRRGLVWQNSQPSAPASLPYGGYSLDPKQLPEISS